MAERIPNRCWNAPPRPAVDELDRVDFNDPEVTAAIEKAAREFRLNPEMKQRLAQFDRHPPSLDVLLTILP